MNTISVHSRLYQIAEQQGGYSSPGQARRAGLSEALHPHHIRQGRFLCMRRGVYRLAECPETAHADLMVAWLGAGEKAVVSHENALLLYGLTDLLPAGICLTVPRTVSRRLAGVRLHTARLNNEEITFRHGLPVTCCLRVCVSVAPACSRSGCTRRFLRRCGVAWSARRPA